MSIVGGGEKFLPHNLIYFYRSRIIKKRPCLGLLAEGGRKVISLCSITNSSSNLHFFSRSKISPKGDIFLLAEARGFEPPIRLPAYTRSRRAPSTTRPHFHSLNHSTSLSSRPLYFVRSGSVGEFHGTGGSVSSLHSAGQSSYNWSSFATGASFVAYDLNFDSSGVKPSASYARYTSLPLRCLASWCL